MKNKLNDIALNRSKRLSNISNMFYRKLNVQNYEVELKADMDYYVASDENIETTLEMIERFKTV